MDVTSMAEMTMNGETPDILFWVGCAGSFDERAQKITRAVAKILTHCEVKFEIPKSRDRIAITASAKIAAQTGVEMEALTAVSVAALTVYDMCKALEKGMTITDVRLESKTGGKSGDYERFHAKTQSGKEDR